MGLSCKAGSCMDVFMKLIKQFIDQRDIFLLFGPVDILIRFNKIESLEEFTQKWFNPIRMIGAEEDLITKTFSFITVSEGPEINSKPFAFVFFDVKPKNLETVRTKLLGIPEVISADSVYGHFDLITAVDVKDQIELETLVLLMQQINGVENTTTSVVAGANLLPDY